MSVQQSETKLQSGVTDTSGHLDIRSLMQASLSGQDPEKVAYGKSGNINPEPLVEPEDTQAEAPEAEAEKTEDTTSASPDTDEAVDTDSADAESEEPANKKALDSSKDIEEVTLKIRDKNGRFQKVQINYADRAAIKKAYVEAAGMRKFQVERDQERKRATDIQSKFDELHSTYSKLDEAFQRDGAKGVIRLLGGKDKDAWKAAVDAELEHREYYSNLTPAEKFKLEAEQREQEYQARLAAAEQKNQAFMKQVEEREDNVSRQSLEAKLHPAFDRYRFAGKLGDEVIEHQFDEAIWNKVMARLGEYPEDVELTQALVDREFREVSNNFRKIVSKQAEKTVKTTLEKKKADSAERVQTMAKKGLSGNTDQKQFMDNLKTGNIQEAFKAMFTGKAKL